LYVYDIRMRGRLAVIALSMVLVLSSVGIYLSPVYGGSATVTFDGLCTPTCDPQDWFTAENWDTDLIPLNDEAILIGDSNPIEPKFDVNIYSPNTENILHPSGSLYIFDGNTLTIKDGATLNHFAIQTITVESGATLTVDGILSNNFASMIVDGILVVTATGTLDNINSGTITGTGVIEDCGGTINDPGAGISISIVACSAGAAVGSTSIPIDSTPMLVAGSEMNSIWITLAIAAAIGVGILIIRKNYFSAE